MPPIQLYSNWNQRPSDLIEKTEPLRRYFILCEGANTEKFYFKKIINLKKEIGIHSLVEILFMNKTDIHHNLSNPKQLVEFAKTERKKLIKSDEFKKERDIMLVTFDLDVFRDRDFALRDLLNEQDDNLIFGLANPDFELFLLLHIEDSFNNIISPNKELILKNVKEGKQRPCQRLLNKEIGLNPKKNEGIGRLASNVDIAIKQEKYLNQNPDYFLTKLSSNIATIIEKMKEEKSPF